MAASRTLRVATQVATLGLEVIEELDDDGRSEIVEVECSDGSRAPRRHEPQQKSEAVAVAVHGMGAQAAQARKMVGEELVQRAGQRVGQDGGHGSAPERAETRPPQCRAKRSLAHSANCGTSDK